jgi:hypothetical protein
MLFRLSRPHILMGLYNFRFKHTSLLYVNAKDTEKSFIALVPRVNFFVAVDKGEERLRCDVGRTSELLEVVVAGGRD